MSHVCEVSHQCSLRFISCDKALWQHSPMGLVFHCWSWGWVWPSDSTCLWIRVNLSCSCPAYTIYRIIIFLCSWRQGPAQGATPGEQTKALWQKIQCWQILLGSFALHARPALTLFSLGQPKQDNAVETFAFMILPWILCSTSKCIYVTELLCHQFFSFPGLCSLETRLPVAFLQTSLF